MGFWPHTFVPREVPMLEWWFCDFEERRSALGSLTVLGNGKGKVLVGLASVGLAAVDGRVDFETDIKELASEEVDSVQLLSVWVQGCAGSKMAYWSGGKTHPRVGHPPSRWNVCAQERETREVTAAADRRKLRATILSNSVGKA